MTKFERICDAIIEQIEAGDLREGDRLPSEEQLASSFGVSVGTVQKSLASLAQSGLVSREHGRGTFVLGSRVRASEINYLRFRDADGNDLAHYIHVRSVKRLSRHGPWSDFLGGDGRYIRIERVTSVGGSITLYNEFWLRESDFERLDGTGRHRLEKNLRVLLGQQLALPTLKVDQLIRFERVREPIARELGIDPASPAFVMEIRGYTLRDQPLFYQLVYTGPFSENLVIVR